MHNRIYEEITIVPNEILNNSSKKKFDDFLFNFDKEADSSGSISPNIPIKVSGFGKNGNSDYIVGYRCEQMSCFFDTPIDSSLLGINTYENVSNTPTFFDMSIVDQKYFRIPHRNKFMLVAIHSSFQSFTS